MSCRMLSQTDLQRGELGPGQPSVYEQYSAEAHVGPGEAQAGPQAPLSIHCWVCGLQDLPPPEVHSVYSLCWRLLPVGGRPLPGMRESMRLSFLALTVLYRPSPLLAPTTPAAAGRLLSISCHIFPVLQTGREKSPAGPFAKPGGETEHCSECFEPGLSQGSAGYPEAVSRLDVRAATLGER